MYGISPPGGSGGLQMPTALCHISSTPAYQVQPLAFKGT